MKKWLIAALSIMLCVILVGCGGPKKVTNQEITLNLSFGDRVGTYTGEVNDKNVPNGKGKFTTKNSAGKVWYYEGQFKDGHFEGQGKEVWPDERFSHEGTLAYTPFDGHYKRMVK